MRSILTFFLLSLLSINAFSQTQGISYQAVIIDKNAQEVPGLDISGNIMPNRAIMIRFTILDAAGTIDYQEEHATTTDAYGMINLIIGQGTLTAQSPKAFNEIDWDGRPKELKVDISLSTTNAFYTDFSRQELQFIPYAYHKNITATGTLKVDSKSTLQDLEVNASANLNGILNVNNTQPTHLSGTLTVDENAVLNKELRVSGISRMSNHLMIDVSNASGAQADFYTYPLSVKGVSQGVSIKMSGTRNSETNFITFFDSEGAQGRIEGETKNEVFDDPMWYFENARFVTELGIAIKDVVAILTSSAPCVGLGVCVTTPSVSMTIAAIARLVIRTIQIILYNVFRFEHAGVVFKTYGSDYAEYLPKANQNEVFYPGDIVGVKGGYITKWTDNADMVMVITSQPTVLGNMPKPGEEKKYEKVAFVGQVPTKVEGIVNPGDFILPSGNNDGSGIAISPEDIEPYQYLKIVGVAWPNSDPKLYGYTNVAVGIRSNDVARLSIKQDEKILALETKVDSLHGVVDKMNAILAELLPDFAAAMGIDPSKLKKVNQTHGQTCAPKANVSSTESNEPEEQKETIYYLSGLTDEQVAEGIDLAETMLREQGVDVSKHQFFIDIKTKSGYKESFIKELKSTVYKELDKAYERDTKAGLKVVKLY